MEIQVQLVILGQPDQLVRQAPLVKLELRVQLAQPVLLVRQVPLVRLVILAQQG